MTDKFIIESFWQKKANCATVAIIKAAILKYGLNRVFTVRKKLGTYVVILKNKKLLTLTDADINRINRKNDITFSRYRVKSKKEQLNKLRNYARFCFAVIVRNIQLYGFDGKEYTQSAAVHNLLLKGIKTDHLHDLLGLTRRTQKAHRLTERQLPALKNKKGLLLYTHEHIVVASEGYYEDYGKAIVISDDIPLLKGKKAKFWYELK
jgi:hypothetical protein